MLPDTFAPVKVKHSHGPMGHLSAKSPLPRSHCVDKIAVEAVPVYFAVSVLVFGPVTLSCAPACIAPAVKSMIVVTNRSFFISSNSLEVSTGVSAVAVKKALKRQLASMSMKAHRDDLSKATLCRVRFT